MTFIKTLGCGAAAVLFLACGGPGTGGPDGGIGGSLLVNSDVTSATTWPATTADCDVTVDGVINVSAALTVAAGAKVCFNANAGIIVTQTGSIHAAGTTANRIAFTSISPTPGYWKGLAVLSNDVANLLDYTDVSYGGNDAALCCGFFDGTGDVHAGLIVGDGSTSSRLTFSHSTVSHSLHDGLVAFDNARLDGFTGNGFTANAGVPLSVYLLSASALDPTGTYSGGSAANGVEQVRVVRSSTATPSDVTLHKLDVPYGMGLGQANAVFEINAHLTIEAGADLRFESNTGILVNQTGTITVAGTPTAHVKMTGRSPTPGFWKGVAMLSTGNTFTDADLSYGGNADSFCCGFFEPVSGSPATKAIMVVGDYATTAGVTLTDVTLTQSANRGITRILGTVTQAGTNDLSTGNAVANLL